MGFNIGCCRGVKFYFSILWFVLRGHVFSQVGQGERMDWPGGMLASFRCRSVETSVAPAPSLEVLLRPLPSWDWVSGPKSGERGLRVRNLSWRGSKGVREAGVLKGDCLVVWMLCCHLGEGRALFSLVVREFHKLVRVLIFVALWVCEVRKVSW